MTPPGGISNSIDITMDKRTFQIMDTTVPMDRSLKMKEIEKFGQNQELVREQPKVWNMKFRLVGAF